MMTKITSFICAAVVSVAATAWGAETTAARQPNQQQEQQGRPNIVLILADDVGYSDFGCFGGEIATPNVDRLAAQGVRLTQFYNQARCCPSRAVLMTGRWPHQVGIGTMIDNYAKWERDAANSPAYQDHLSTATPTMAERLRGAGYRTMMVGKWHLGDRPDEWPCKRGFDRSFVLIPGAMNYYGGGTTGPRTPMALDDQRFVPPHDGFYSTDAFTDRAVEFLDEAKGTGKPFFLYLAYNASHWPLQAPEDEIEPYKGKYDAGWQPIREARFKRQVEMGLVDKSQGMAPMDRGRVKAWDELTPERRAQWAMRMSVYAAQTTRMDKGIGRVLAELDKLGVTENTVVVFVSDNGGAAEDPNRSKPGAALGTRDSFQGYARPWATVSNTPWRYHKCSAYEGGTSAPFVVRWPAGQAKDKQGTMVREPGHLVDLVPTLLDLAGVKDKPKELEGQSLVPMFHGDAGDKERTYFWEHEGNRAIRKGSYKLVSLPGRPWELYDIDHDRTESHDLAAERPEMVKALEAEYQAWAKRVGVIPFEELEKRRDKKSARVPQEEDVAAHSS